jgi:hypothetical protein
MVGEGTAGIAYPYRGKASRFAACMLGATPTAGAVPRNARARFAGRLSRRRSASTLTAARPANR